MSKEEIRKYLTDNLEISIDGDTYYGCTTHYIKIKLEGEVISSDSINVYDSQN